MDAAGEAERQEKKDRIVFVVVFYRCASSVGSPGVLLRVCTETHVSFALTHWGGGDFRDDHDDDNHDDDDDASGDPRLNGDDVLCAVTAAVMAAMMAAATATTVLWCNI